MSNDESTLSQAVLIVDSSMVFSFEDDVISIGRALENDLVLDYPQISRKHAELRYQQGKFEIVDLGSSGGVYVNGKKIERQVLSKGDVITLTNLHLVFGLDEPISPKPATQYKPPSYRRLDRQETKVFYGRRRRTR